MEQKPKFVNYLIVSWIIIGILFISNFLYIIQQYLQYIQFDFSGTGSTFLFTSVTNMIFIIFFFIFSLLLAHRIFVKKNWTWLASLMFATYILITNIRSTITIYGVAITSHSISSVDIIYILHYLIFVPISAALAAFVIYLSLKPSVKEYFGEKYIPKQLIQN